MRYAIFPIAIAVTVVAVLEAMWKTVRDEITNDDTGISTLLGVVHPHAEKKI